MAITLNTPHSGTAEPNPADEWVATIIRLQKRIPALGSVANINRLLVTKDGLPYRRIGRRLLFNIPEVSAWMSNQAGVNLPPAA